MLIRQRKLSILRWFAVVCAYVLFVASASAQSNGPEQLFDQYRLHAHAEAEVVNDLLSVELLVQGQDKNSSSLANRINADMQWALNELKKHATVKSRTRNYRTWPQYERNNRRIVGWNASQSLLIETEDFEAGREAIQMLQQKLQVTNMQMRPKVETRTAMEDSLINEALNRFKARAEIVQLNMGAADFRIIDIDINTGQQGGVYEREYFDQAVRTEAQSAPAIQSGTSTVRVQIHGRIQLQ